MTENEGKSAIDTAEENEYRFAPGSGVAAILLFLHIALTGYLAFAMYFVIRAWNSGVIRAPAMSWQYFFPAGLAVFSFFPTDGLTRAVAWAARITGTVALVVAICLTVAFEMSRGHDVSPSLLHLAMITMGGLGAGVLAAEWFRVGLQQLNPIRRIPITPFNRLTDRIAGVVVAICWMGLMLLLARPAFQYRWIEASVVIVCGLLLASRLLSVRRG